MLHRSIAIYHSYVNVSRSINKVDQYNFDINIIALPPPTLPENTRGFETKITSTYPNFRGPETVNSNI
jgi:hypothetical protein